MIRLFVLLAALGLAIPVPAVPVPTMRQTEAALAGRGHFLAPDAVDIRALLPAPPAPDSPEQRAELDLVLRLQADRTPAQAARARLLDREDVFLFGGDVLGAWFTASNLPKLTRFFAAVREDYTAYNHAAKALFQRRRPPYVDPRIRPCLEYADTGSYPSGHGIQSALWVALLGEIFPDQAAAFAVRATESQRSRLVGGVHYASDVVAGRLLGEALACEMLRNPAVREMLDQLRAESAPFLGK